MDRLLELAAASGIERLRRLAGNESADTDARIGAFGVLHQIEEEGRELAVLREDRQVLADALDAIRAAQQDTDATARFTQIVRAFELFDRTNTAARMRQYEVLDRFERDHNLGNAS